MVGILFIGSCIYHSDVIATNMEIYVNIIQIHITNYLPVYCIQTSTGITVFLRYLVVCSVDSGEFRTRMLIQ